MKAIFCLACFDIKALPSQDRVEIKCNCGNTRGMWYDGQRGLALVDGSDRNYVRVMGIHNGWLSLASNSIGRGNAWWREETKKLLAACPGYLFSEQWRNCPVAIIRVGESNDITWYDNQSYFEHKTGPIEAPRPPGHDPKG